MAATTSRARRAVDRIRPHRHQVTVLSFSVTLQTTMWEEERRRVGQQPIFGGSLETSLPSGFVHWPRGRAKSALAAKATTAVEG